MSRKTFYEALRRYARSQDTELNSDRDFVLDIIDGLLKNESATVPLLALQITG